jgi:signal transduction histidine kinase/putative methionine-R-sulfoxide reductase with GAF domain
MTVDTDPLLEWRRLEGRLLVARWCAAAVALVTVPWLPSFGPLGVLGVAATLGAANLVLARALKAPLPLARCRTIGIAMLALDAAALVAWFALLSPSSGSAAYLLGLLLIVEAALRFEVRGATVVGVLFALAWLAMQAVGWLGLGWRPHLAQLGLQAVVLSVVSGVVVGLVQSRNVESARSIQRLRESDHLRAILSQISAELDVARILESVIRSGMDLLQVESGGISLWDEARNCMVVDTVVGMPASLVGTEILQGEGITSRVARERRTVILESYPFFDSPTAIFNGIGYAAVIGTPIWLDGRLLGVLHLNSKQHLRQLAEEDRRSIETLAQQVGSAIKNARLYAEAQRRGQELARLNQAIEQMNQNLLASSFAQDTVETLVARFDITLASLWRVKTPSGDVELQALAGREPPAAGASGASVPAAVAAVASMNLPLFANDVDRNPQFADDPLCAGMSLRGFAGFPLLVGDRLVGVLALYDRLPLDRSAIEVFTAFAQHAAVALQEATLFQITRQQSERLESANSELNRANRHKSEFLANMSHELRTPLNSIIGFSQLLLDGTEGPLTEEQRQDLQIVCTNGQHLLGLINDLLDLAKIESGHSELVRIAFNFGALVTETINLLKPLARERGLRLEQETAPGLDMVTADRGRVKQIIVNLVGNAVKFTEAGGVVVTARPDDAGTGLLVSVRDTGLGIAAADQTRIFESFQQGTLPAPGRYHGTGLGLTISRHYVELHGGRIWVESKVGEGSTFYFTLPESLAASEQLAS